MFRLFKKKSEIDLLNEQYNKLLKEAYQLSTSNRIKSDEKYTEAEQLLKRIEVLEQKS